MRREASRGGCATWWARILPRRKNDAARVAVRVVAMRSTGESAPAAAVTLAFRNDSAGDLEVRSYELRWPGGVYRGAPRDLRVAPGPEVERVVRVDMTSGDVAALLRSPYGEGFPGVSVEVLCAR